MVTGTNLAEAIHRLALWVGGLSTAGAICTRGKAYQRKREMKVGVQRPPRQQSLEKYR